MNLILTILTLSTWAFANPLSKAPELVAQDYESRRTSILQTTKKDLITEGLDMDKFFGQKFTTGTAFGARASVMIPTTPDKIAAFFGHKETLSHLEKYIKTILKSDWIDKKGDEAYVRLLIDIPVDEDLPVKVWIKVWQNEGRAFLSWRQDDLGSRLSSTWGQIFIEAKGDNSIATIYGMHVLKDEHALNWLKRSVGRSFTKDHYGNFVSGPLKYFGRE